MTKVSIKRGGGRCLLSAKGHATGSPEVCAAISSIIYAFAGYMTNAMRDRYVEFYTWKMDSGDVLLDFNGDAGTDAAFEMVVIGLRQIEQSFPEFICVSLLEE